MAKLSFPKDPQSSDSKEWRKRGTNHQEAAWMEQKGATKNLNRRVVMHKHVGLEEYADTKSEKGGEVQLVKIVK